LELEKARRLVQGTGGVIIILFGPVGENQSITICHHSDTEETHSWKGLCWAECKLCHSVGPSFDGYTEWKYPDGSRKKCEHKWNMNGRKITQARNKAKAARFEFGQSPKR
jgi:hypothetical protein